LSALVDAAPGGVIQAAAGLALLGTLASSLSEALEDPSERESAVVTFVVAASGISVLGVGAAFWALVAGLVVRAVIRRTSATTRG
jgi:benzoate membrane transport protein